MNYQRCPSNQLWLTDPKQSIDPRLSEVTRSYHSSFEFFNIQCNIHLIYKQSSFTDSLKTYVKFLLQLSQTRITTIVRNSPSDYEIAALVSSRHVDRHRLRRVVCKQVKQLASTLEAYSISRYTSEFVALVFVDGEVK